MSLSSEVLLLKATETVKRGNEQTDEKVHVILEY